MLKDWVMVHPVKDPPRRRSILHCVNELTASTSLVKSAMAKKRKQNQPPRRKCMKTGAACAVSPELAGNL